MNGRALLASARRELERRGRAVGAQVLLKLPGAARAFPPGQWGFGGSVGAHYGDNSASLYRHVRANRRDVDCWWAINRGSPDVERARAEGRIVFRDEVSAVALAHTAEVLVISHGIHDVPGADTASQALRVRLGHGLTAMKRTKAPALRTVAQMHRGFDLVPVSSEFERDNKATWGIPHDRLVVTGLARFDDLLRRARAQKPSSTILYMPTWRDWLAHDAEGIRGTRFFSEVTALLSSTTLQAVLREHDLHLEVYLHRLMHQHAHSIAREVGSERIRVLPVDVDVQAHLASARLLITDYSSVTWDMLYLDRPVVFFHFDVDDYSLARGAYFDMRTDMPGPVAATVTDLVRCVRDVVDNGDALSSAALRWQHRVFAFRDDNNCARIVAAIESRLGRTVSEVSW